MSNSWLQQFIEDAIEQKLCVEIGCTTCGAGPFRRGLARGLAKNSDVPEMPRLTPEAATVLAMALTQVKPRSAYDYEFTGAVRLILYKMWFDCGGTTAEAMIWPLLADCWAGEVLAAMQRHYNAVLQEKAQGPILQQRRREEKHRAKAQRIAERAERKAANDALWRAGKLPFQQSPSIDPQAE